MSKTANFHRPSQGRRAETFDKHAETDNVCLVPLSILESSALRACVGCGRRFVPSGPQRYCSHECYSGTLRTPIEQRFWTKVNKFGPVPAHRPELGRCWLWTAATLRGYGQISRNRKPAYAHRVAYELTYGPLEARGHDECVLHKCDEPLCVRPDHLFLGTQADNLDDARAKGRLDESRPRDTDVLTYADRLSIYATRSYPGVVTALARQYGVTKSCISLIRKGRFARLPDSANVERVAEPRLVPVPIRGDLHLTADSAVSDFSRQGNRFPAEGTR